ncbi:MAG TPA: hypothetical protein VE129_03945, partial [Thermoanaerobaculia bacterium]|nr:hypothetical protein [Thermoanaerobaculia bacterium]
MKGSEPGAAEARSPRSQRLLDRRTALVSAGILAAVPIIGYFTWWGPEKKTTFHFRPEGFFGSTTYTGGADKASHFVTSAILEDG